MIIMPVSYTHLEEPYSTALQQMGIEILYGDDWASGIWDWLKRNKDEIDFAYLNRPHIATKYVDFIKENTNIKVIYYGHEMCIRDSSGPSVCRAYLKIGRRAGRTGSDPAGAGQRGARGSGRDSGSRGNFCEALMGERQQ